MLQNATFWVAVAFFIFVGFAFKPGRKAILAMLDDRADKIRAELEEAQRLREDAQKTLAEAQRRQRDALKEADDIVAHAREEAERLRKQAAADLEAAMKRRESQAMDKIAQAEAQAVAEVRNLTVDVALQAGRQLLVDTLNTKQGTKIAEKLIESSITELPKHLH